MTPYQQRIIKRMDKIIELRKRDNPKRKRAQHIKEFIMQQVYDTRSDNDIRIHP